MSGLPLPAGFVLAGGRSSRMGRDKAMIELDGLPLVARALASLQTVATPVKIAGDRVDLASFATVVRDQKGEGPLAGIHAALSTTDAEWNIFLPVDLPLIPSGLLGWMVDRVRLTGALATLPLVCGVPQPMVGVYHRSLLPGLERSLDAGHFKTIHAVLAAAGDVHHSTAQVDLFPVEALCTAGQFADFQGSLPVHRWFQNLNTPADLEASLAMRS